MARQADGDKKRRNPLLQKKTNRPTCRMRHAALGPVRFIFNGGGNKALTKFALHIQNTQ